GAITANGGAGDNPPNGGGGGGGGRIAIYYNTNLFSGQISAYGGAGFVPGGAGTIYKRRIGERVGQLLVDNGGRFGTNTGITTPEAFPLAVVGGAVVNPLSDAPLVLQSLFLGSGCGMTHLNLQTNLNVIVLHDATMETN